jgi:hypothetical protein
MNEEYGNADRLAVLGATALDFSVTRYFYFLRPQLSKTEIRVCVFLQSFLTHNSVRVTVVVLG